MNQFEQLARTRKAAAILSVLRRAQGAEVSDATLLSYLDRTPDAFTRAALVAGVRPPSAETRATVVEMIRGFQATERRDEPKRSPRPYRCAECGKRYTLRGAERAMAKGCAAGCSGIDIEEAA